MFNKLELKLKAKHEDSVIAQYLNVVNQINYFNESIKPNFPNMEKWEVLEYKVGLTENMLIYEHLQCLIINNESLFNDILVEYDLNTAIFLTLYKLKQ